MEKNIDNSKAVKYDVLISYLNVLIKKDDTFIRVEEVKNIIDAMEEGEKSE